MGWTDICAWTGCLGGKQDEKEEIPSERVYPVATTRYVVEEVPEKQPNVSEPLKKPPPPPPSSVVSDEPKPQAGMERDLPPVPAIPLVYELGLASPRYGVTRSNSRASTKTSASSKSRRRRTQTPDLKRTSIGQPTDLRKVEGAMPGTDSAGYRGGLRSVSASRRTSTHRPLTLSIHEEDGRLAPLPTFSQRSSSTNSRDFVDAPMTIDDGDIWEDETSMIDDDAESLKILHRRSDSAPIPVSLPTRTSSVSHTIRRKPVTPKPSKSFARPHTMAGSQLETYAEQLGTPETPIEMYVPAFELSADPKSRTQSYYADAGAALLAATLDEVPPLPDMAVSDAEAKSAAPEESAVPEEPSASEEQTVPEDTSTALEKAPKVPEKTPHLVVKTDFKRHSSARTSRSSRSSSVNGTPSSKKLPFSPLTTVGSPVDNPSVSPLTPGSRSLYRLTIFKRSKSVGPSSRPQTMSASLKRRSLEVAPPMPTLPSTIYVPGAPLRTSLTNSLAKTESTKDSSRRTSNSSDSSETTSQSSQPSRGPSPSMLKTQTKTKKEEPELEMLKPIAFQRRSTNAPIPISFAEAPPVPVLPPQAYHFTPPKPIEPEQTELVRSNSSENLRAKVGRSSADPKRSKSTYVPAQVWSMLDIGKPKSKQSKQASVKAPPSYPPPPPPPAPAAIPTTKQEPEATSKTEPEAKPVPTEIDPTAELESETPIASRSRSPIEETEPRTEFATPTEEKDLAEEPWGKGMGAAWGVAY